MRRRVRFALLVAAGVLSAALVPAVAPAGAASATTTTAASSEPAVTGLAFYTTYSPAAQTGADPEIRVGYATHGNATVFFALRDANGTFVGHTEPISVSPGMAVDGWRVPCADLAGIHRLTVTAYVDDGDGEFDPSTDRRLATNATLTFVFANDSPALGNATMVAVPATNGTSAVHHVTLPITGDLNLSSVALDYRYTGVPVDWFRPSDISVKLRTSDGIQRLTPANVSTTAGGVLVVNLSRAHALHAGDRVVVSVSTRNPPHPHQYHVTVLVNPYAPDAATADAVLAVTRPVPTINRFYGGGPHDVRASYYVPTGRSGFLVVERNGTAVGRVRFDAAAGGRQYDRQPIALTGDFTGSTRLTLVAYNDTNANGAFDPGVDQAFTRNWRRVATNQTFDFGPRPGTTPRGGDDTFKTGPARAGAYFLVAAVLAAAALAIGVVVRRLR